MRYVVAPVFMLISFMCTSVALAQTNGELANLAKPVLDAVLSGDWLYAAALALVLAVALVRRFGGSRYPFLARKEVAPFLVLIGAFGAALAHTLSAGAAINVAMLFSALKVAAAAGGGYAVLMKPLLKPLLGKLPAWASMPLMWVVDSKSKAETAKAKGAAAVKANPSTGAPVDFRDVP